METLTTNRIPFNASRAVRETTTYPYGPVLDRLVAKRADVADVTLGVLSDKIAAQMCGVSERQIRKARLHGMDPYLADHLCIRGLGLHPKDVFGEDWLTAEALHAEDLFERRLKPEDIKDYSDEIEAVWAEMEVA